MEPSILSLIPPVLTLVIALWSKNIMLALFLGIVSCSIYTGGLHFLMLVFDKYIYNGISSNVDMFIYMIAFGAFMVAVKRGGGFAAFSSFGDKHFDTPRKAKLITWLLSGIVINQGFGTIGVGAIMRPITDKQKVSREKLGYILSSTAEPVVALVPITIYILVFGGLWGFPGMLLGVPIMAVIYYIVSNVVTYSLKKRGIPETEIDYVNLERIDKHTNQPVYETTEKNKKQDEKSAGEA